MMDPTKGRCIQDVMAMLVKAAKSGMRNIWNSQKVSGKAQPTEDESSSADQSVNYEELEEPSFLLAIAGYIAYLVLVLMGYLREFLYGQGPLENDGRRRKLFTETNREGYAPPHDLFESFLIRNMFRRVKDTFFRPIASVPGATVTVIDRISNDNFWTMTMDESSKRTCINLASYNYLGFAENKGPVIDEAIKAVSSYALAPCSPRQELGSLAVHQRLEETVAEFLGVESAITVGMGFATNALNIPCLFDKNTLVLSDEKNHSSLILGVRLSGAKAVVFKHNNMDNLHRLLHRSIIHGHPKTRRPWKKIFIMVEGVYSMEGSIVKLPEIVELKKKYGVYIYLDEAHSVGAMGPHGRGVVDYYGLDPRDIDIMMGTFTKSFGAAGGYIAGSKRLVNFLRVHSHAFAYPSAMSASVAQQVISSMRAIMDTEDGVHRVRQLAENAKYFRRKLKAMGCIVYGNDDSPVVPMMLFLVTKIGAFVNALLEHDIVSIGVGFPATNMTEERIRFCISANHTKEMLDTALNAIDKISNTAVHVKYARKQQKLNQIE